MSDIIQGKMIQESNYDEKFVLQELQKNCMSGEFYEKEESGFTLLKVFSDSD
ncbi:hypothetical protein KC799_09690 [candidate division KSB1 bacterium]|nr:hypothetical protein [candidate division KSB1 bacterium]